ncbi:DUF4179 domain-containing protein [Clostridium sp. CS001]|uniref:DUF4179 domain-containing protein n=1 Tax=Clostridium sp. CS001 TaxID=2880648 RepID=UPI001CF59CD2|nr:DUF4179 domain-containing protein [Clostridium sp. CS001]MCB2290950.1 DUF4179 domain-containing protein [Clostridium sp. CS001]
MNEKDIFNIAGTISEEDLNIIMDKTYTIDHIECSVTNYNEKERIRANLHDKIKKDIQENAELQQNTTNINNYPLVASGNKVLKLKQEYKKSKIFTKNKTIKNVLKSFVAAMLVFVISVNIFPSLALALANIPGLNKLIKVVSFDKGFNNVIYNGNIQELNTTVEGNGSKFTITTITGDDLKLWIGYELENENLFVGDIKFKNVDNGKDLPWIGTIPNKDENYIKVLLDRLVKNFKMEVAIYRDDPSFHIPIHELDEKAINDIKQLLEKNKVTTLNIPVSLNDKIYNDGLRVLNIQGKEFKNEIAAFKIEKLELADSRSRVYCKLISDEYELVDVLVPRLIDGEGKNYSSSDGFLKPFDNNTICLELSGGIKDVKGLSFNCNGFKYKSKKPMFITIDLKNKGIDPNNLGISLIDVDSSNIILNVPGNAVEFSFQAKNKNGTTVKIKTISEDSFEEKVSLEFDKFKDDVLILEVKSIRFNPLKNLEMKLVD